MLSLFKALSDSKEDKTGEPKGILPLITGKPGFYRYFKVRIKIEECRKQIMKFIKIKNDPKSGKS
jgi:hypothetical protein